MPATLLSFGMPAFLPASMPASPPALPPAGSSAGAAPAARGEWPLSPVPRVVERFSPPSAPWAAGHRGVDLLGSPGQRVHSARAGTVNHAAPIAGRGVVVVNHHDGTRTTYEPVLASVEVGDELSAGDQLGWLTTSASHCLPSACLHWGWRRGETYLDPLLLVGRPNVRLFPLGRPSPAPTQARGWAWE